MYNSDLPSRAELPSSRQLVRSTLMALVIAVLLLVTVILPAEYGIDPTGVGGALGLAEMGEIKQQLALEAEADAAMAAAEEAAAPASAPSSTPSTGESAVTPAEEVEGGAAAASSVADANAWRDEFTMTFAPAQGDDIKLVMSPGDTVQYEWTVDRGHLNSDLHTDNGPDGRSHSYRQGRAETEVAAEFTAITEGTHGWFWRNRSDEVVTVTLRVRGTYRDVRR